MDSLKIGQYIQNLRKAAGLTQKELAEKLNLSFQAVSKWENGDSLPDTGVLLDLCDILNTTADKLLNGGKVSVVSTPLTIGSITANTASAAPGATITWTASASGGAGTLQYCFYVFKDGKIADMSI